MELMLNFIPPKNEAGLHYQDKVMLIGSCFTEHIGNFLGEHKFQVMQNPNGILFDTLSVCRAISGYLDNQELSTENLFQYNELWHHWQYHSKFSGINKDLVIQKINEKQLAANAFLFQADWLILTLGSSFAYRLNASTPKEVACADFVANCHKAPSQWFEKYLIPIEEQVAELEKVLQQLRKVNPNLKIIFTISPVRHIRDGVVENNRSKARLIETVHHLKTKMDRVYYFAAYEILIDVLRDYRFYDIDLVHPNYMGTNFVLDHFIRSFLDPVATELLEKIKPIIQASKHKAFNPDSIAHKMFLAQNLEKIKALLQSNPDLNFEKEISYFSGFYL